jgi:hypothetical protein
MSYTPTDKDVYGQEPVIDKTGELHIVKCEKDFLDLPIGSYIVDCHFWHIPVNGAHPVSISRKIRQPSQKELNEPCPLNDTLFLIAKFTPQKKQHENTH